MSGTHLASTRAEWMSGLAAAREHSALAELTCRGSTGRGGGVGVRGEGVRVRRRVGVEGCVGVEEGSGGDYIHDNSRMAWGGLHS